jgi:intracellular sulfur oxidation DsrE/DsrF family protein
MIRIALTALAGLLLAAPAIAQTPNRDAFTTGPVFEDFGPHAPVEGGEPLPSFSRFAIAFDVATAADDGTRNRGFESAARFINMHVAAGVPEDRIALAVVVHGKATLDLTTREGNASADMVEAMLARGVRFIVCGQSAAAYGVKKADLIEGVELHLSAMTAHALLQQDGYTVNPF